MGNFSTGACCNYDNFESNTSTYWRFYWYAINSGMLAPTGWHVPTDEEWTMLENFVATNPSSSGSIAKAMASTTNWSSSTDKDAICNVLKRNNSTGFTAQQGGDHNCNGNIERSTYFRDG